MIRGGGNRSRLKPLVDEGFFISPEGEFLLVSTSHIALVIAEPCTFGLTQSRVLQEFAKCREPVGLEGRARERILGRLLGVGWIRARRHPNRGWAIELSEWSVDAQRRIVYWAETLRGGFQSLIEVDEYAEVRIRGIEDDHFRSCEFREIPQAASR